MKKFIFQIIGLLVVIFGGIWVTFNSNSILPFLSNISTPFPISGGANSNPSQTNAIKIVGPDGKVKAQMHVEIADNPQKRQQGLSGRDSVDPNGGMLFVFDKPEVLRFWMKEMKIPLDFIWINGNEIKDVLINVPPPQTGSSEQVLPIYSPNQAVDRVLEVNAGFVQAHSIAVGDKIVSE